MITAKKYLNNVNHLLVDMTTQQKGLVSAVEFHNDKIVNKSLNKFIKDFNMAVQDIHFATFRHAKLVDLAFRTILNKQRKEQYVDKVKEQRIVDQYLHDRIPQQIDKILQSCSWINRSPSFKAFLKAHYSTNL